MARPQTFSKKENEKKKQARRLEKQNRKEERKLSGNTNSFEDMIAYVDENGRITSTPPGLFFLLVFFLTECLWSCHLTV